jgi:hypothetical protein
MHHSKIKDDAPEVSWLSENHARNLSENWNDGLLEYWNNGYQKKKEKSDGRME